MNNPNPSTSTSSGAYTDAVCCRTGNIVDYGDTHLCLPQTHQILATHSDTNNVIDEILVCINDSNGPSGTNSTSQYPSGTNVVCGGRLVKIKPGSYRYTYVTTNDTPMVYYPSGAFDNNITPYSTTPTQSSQHYNDASPAGVSYFISY